MKIDRVHFYTRDAATTKDWFINNVGFKAIGNANNKHTQTEIIALNSACLVFSSPVTNSSPVKQYLDSHPSGVADVVFQVDDVEAIVDRAKHLGLKILQQPQIKRSPQGIYKTAQIEGWGDLQHTSIEKLGVTRNLSSPTTSNHFDSKIVDIDHIVLNVAAGQLNSAVKLYRELFGFKIQQSFDIQTKTSGLYSQALVDDSGRVQFNINEPTSANSQIQEFIDLNRGSGIQHLALRSQNLIADVEQMRGVDFLTIPQSYYSDRLYQLLNLTTTEWQAIIKQQILVDRQDANSPSLLMQIFSQPIFELPTFFIEFIERRHQAQGFGRGNFKALFEAVEREQIKSEVGNAHPTRFT